MNRELSCAYHQGQIITNFCDDSHCLMPLCPKCLSIHTAEHKKTKTYGSFQPIEDMIERATSIAKQKIEKYKKAMNQTEKSTQNNYELSTTLLKKIKEAKDKLLFEVDSFFNSLEVKCQKMCQEVMLKKQTNQKTESFDAERKIRQQSEYLEGLQKKDKCLMSLIRTLKSELDEPLQNINNSSNNLSSQGDLSQSDGGALLKKIHLRVDLEKINEITESLNSYAKLVYNQTKKHVKFDDKSVSNKSESSSLDSSPILKPNQHESKESRKLTSKIANSIYQREDEQGNDKSSEDSLDNQNSKLEQQSTQIKKPVGFYKDADDIYLINDPDIIRLKQRKEERRIRSELRDIGKKKPQESQNSINAAAGQNNSKVRRPPSTEYNPEPQSSFITFEKPTKEQLKQYAKPEELEFIEKVQKKSVQMQQEFERQQNEIFYSAMNYQIPVPQRNIYQPKQFSEQLQQPQQSLQQQHQQQQQQLLSYASQQEIPSSVQIQLRKQSLSQPETDLTSPSSRQSNNINQQYANKPSYPSTRSPLADRFDQNFYNQESSKLYHNNGYENNFANGYGSVQNQSMSSYQSPNKSTNNQFKFDLQNNSLQNQQLQNQNRYFN